VTAGAPYIVMADEIEAMEGLRCIVVGKRLAHDVGDYPRQGKRIYRNAGMDWNLVDHDAIGLPKGGAK